MAFQFRIQAAAEEQQHHLEVRDERPFRVLEGGRAVFLKTEMSGPGKTVTDHGSKKDPGRSLSDEADREPDQCEQGSDDMQTSANVIGVLRQVEGPEFFKALVVLAHGVSLGESLLTVKF